jgi:16S rRNA (guanine527-N7)-methyltransferase
MVRQGDDGHRAQADPGVPDGERADVVPGPSDEVVPHGAIPAEALAEASEVTRELAGLGLSISADHARMFARYLQRVRERSRHVNLVSGGDLARLGRRHLLESFNILSCPLDLSRGPLADAGSGAGFPGLPLALLLPELRVLLVESVQKKARFLREMVDEFGLAGRVRVEAERVEVLAARPELAGAFNAVTVRGMGPLSRVVPWCAPLLRARGHLVAFKGTGIEEELRGAIETISSHGLELADIVHMRWGEGRLLILRRRR